MEAIWKAVLVRMLRDLVSTGISNEPIRRDAERWVGDFPSFEFRTVCNYAGVDHIKAHRVLRQFCDIDPSERTSLLDELDSREVGSERTSHEVDGRRVAASAA